MKKKLSFSIFAIILLATLLFTFQNNDKQDAINIKKYGSEKRVKKSLEEKRLFSLERQQHEINMQKNPLTGEIPLEEKQREFENSLEMKRRFAPETTSSTYVSRGPSNLGGRTRAFAIDVTDATSNTIIAGGVSSGVFRTTDGGDSWTKVSSNDEIHNVTSIAQDTRTGFENTWYYATGEFSGNSASLGAFNLGRGIWKSIDNGLTWNQIAATDSNQDSFDSNFDLIHKIVVSPTTGDLFIATLNGVYRYDGTSIVLEVEETSTSNRWSDVVTTSTGRIYVAIDGQSFTDGGVYTSSTGNGSWTKVAENGDPTTWFSRGRQVLAVAPSNENIIYTLFQNGNSGGVEADLWQYNLMTDTWVDYSGKLPDEPGGDLTGNDPFAIQGGYDLVLSVKPDDENFVVIGGTNIYKIEDILNDVTFSRIGGYVSNTSYGLYEFGGDTHHPDIHALVFDPNNTDVLFSGTDGGVHKTIDVFANTVTWVNLNNNYQTYQYYHVALDPLTGGNTVFGGAQDNGTTRGGTDVGLPNNTEMSTFFGGDGVAVGIARRNSNTQLQYYYGTQNGNMRTNLPNFRSIRPSGSSSQFITYFYLDPDNNDHLYYAGLSTLYKTDDAENVTTVTWINIGALSTSQNIRSFATTRGAYDPASSYLLIGGERGGIFRLDDPQNATSASDAIDITPNDASTSNGSIVSGLAIHPTNPDIVMAVYSNYGINSIFLTSNATSASPTWTLVERNLDAHSVRSTAIAEVGSETIYFVGTARGLYSSNDPENNDWEIEGANEIGFAVVSSLVLRPSDNKLLIGTHGNGMFETTVEGTLSTNSFTQLNKVNLYPNPTQFELNLQGNSINSANKISYRISDLTGKTIQKGLVSNRKIDVEALQTGVYLIDLNIDGKRETSKFIKN
ncbi:MAG: T9SS type A sorting domain-containing protein [Flavobacteriaceae bacterium]